jgi:K(+)-stimulated pyrophosphate-energized sodium pump
MALEGGKFGLNTSMIFCYSAIGLLASIIGVIFGRIGKNGDPELP